MPRTTDPTHTPEWYENALHAEVRRATPYPEHAFAGKGIVLVAGGQGFLAGTWAAVSVLRELGAHLPIELWYFGEEECDAAFEERFRTLGVRCINAQETLRTHPSISLMRPRDHRFALFELKCYAILHARFQEVLFLDADNIPLADPTPLFEDPTYRKTGALFWPDPPYGANPPERAAWQACGLPPQPGPAFESGQLLIDKRRSWHPLQIVWWMNEHSDYWFTLVHGDKDTYKLAWHVLGLPYALAPLPHSTFLGVIQQSPKGHPLFFHRWFQKPSLTDTRLGCPHAPPVVQRAYRQAMATLRTQWDGRFWNTAERPSMIAGLYHSTNDIDHILSLEPDGRVLSPLASERLWHMRDRTLVLQGTERVTCFLEKHERSWSNDSVTLTPLPNNIWARPFLRLRMLQERWNYACSQLLRSLVRGIELAAIAVVGDRRAGTLRQILRGLLKQSSGSIVLSQLLVTTSSFLVILFQALFTIVLLKVGTAEYGSMQSILATVIVLTSIRAATSGHVMMHRHHSRRSNMQAGIVLAVLLGLGLLIVSPLLQTLLHIEKPDVLFLIAAAIFPAMALGLLEGECTAERRFGLLTLSTILVPLLHIVMAVLFLRDGYQETDVGAITFWSFTLTVLLLLPTHHLRPTTVATVNHATESIREIVELFLGSLVFGLAIKIDIMWARFQLDSFDAGSYAIAASLAVILFFATASVAQVAVATFKETHHSRSVTITSLAFILSVSTIGIIFLATFGESLLTMLVGREIILSNVILLPLCIAATAYSIVFFDYTCLNVIDKRVHLRLALMLMAYQVILLPLFGHSAVTIALTQSTVMVLFMLSITTMMLRELREEPSSLQRALPIGLATAPKH